MPCNFLVLEYYLEFTSCFRIHNLSATSRFIGTNLENVIDNNSIYMCKSLMLMMVYIECLNLQGHCNIVCAELA